jgi:hypothetical protein
MSLSSRPIIKQAEVFARDFEYAQLVENPPAQGYLTISNALQWRLQYGRIVTGGIPGVLEIV